MKLSSHEEYGLRCLVCLAQEGVGGRLTIPELSVAEGVSEAYVGKLLRILRLAGFVTAARGTGGYSLARPANQIVLRDVMAVLGGRLFEGDFCETHTGQMEKCVHSPSCSLRVLWSTVQAAVDNILTNMTLDDLLRGGRPSITWVKVPKEFGSLVSSH